MDRWENLNQNYLLFIILFRQSPIQQLFFLSCRPFVTIMTFSTGLVVSYVSWFRQLTELFIFIDYFSTVVPLTSCVFFPVGISSHFIESSNSTEIVSNLMDLIINYLWGYESLRRKTYRKENTTSEWDDGGKISNKNK